MSYRDYRKEFPLPVTGSHLRNGGFLFMREQ